MSNQITEVYCDESCLEALVDKTSHNYIGIGSIWIPGTNRNDLKTQLNKVCDKYGITSEIKWNKISPSTFNFYKEILDVFFVSDYIRSRVIIIESSKVKNNYFNKSDNELSFYKFYYQLLNNWIINHSCYSIFVDLKVNRSKERLRTLRKVLVNTHPQAQILNVQALPSHQSLGIQLADVLTGLVTSKFNAQNTSKAKLGLIKYVETKYLNNIIEPTSKSNQKFNIFKINLREVD